MQIIWAFLWWFLALFLGWSVAPLVFRLFPDFQDRGLGFSKITGLLLATLIVWWVGFWKFTPVTISAVWLGLAVLVWGFSRQQWPEFLAFLRARRRLLFFQECLFSGLFLGYLVFRAFTPELFGTEKFMDLGFLNALIRAPNFPPYDPWMAGPHFSLSYYYFGYLNMAMLAKFSGTPGPVAFNLALGIVFALSGATLFSLLHALTGKTGAALLGCGMVLGLGNLGGVNQFLQLQPGEEYNWFSPSRIIPNTINEFPFFSFLLGDLHPHLLAIPYFLLGLGFPLQYWLQKKQGSLRKHPFSWFIPVWGLAAGSQGFVNSWNLPTLLWIAGATAVAGEGREIGKLSFRERLLRFAAWGYFAVAAVVPYLPFYLEFHTQARGIGWVREQTGLGHILLIFGPFLAPALSYLVLRLFPRLKKSSPDGTPFLSRTGVQLAAAGLALGLAATFLKSPLLGALLAGLAVLCLAATPPRARPDVFFPILLLGTSWLLVAGCEIFYIQDQFPPRLHRMNTVFKFYYQAWLLMGIFAAFALDRLWQERRELRAWGKGLLAFSIVLVGAGLVYPLAALPSKARNFSQSPTLNGAEFLKREFPGDEKGIAWINSHISGHPVILEAIGPQFSEFARVSAFTGLPTVLGWAGHELQWRGTFEEAGHRITDIDQILFGSEDLVRTQRLLDRYRVEFVFLGTLERKKYPPRALEKFPLLLDLVYRNSEGVEIYRRRANTLK